jgi:two-component system sensor histidine kinase KdpD
MGEPTRRTARLERSLGLALLVPGTLAAVTWSVRSLGANATTAGFAYLIAVLLVATIGGWTAGAAASLLATLGYNYFFLPPFGTLTITEPANWVALVSFLAATTLASRLLATARRQTEEARRRGREVEILYELCFGLFATTRAPGVLEESATLTLRAIGAKGGSLHLLAQDVETAEGDGLVSRLAPPLASDPPAQAEALRSRQIVERTAQDGSTTSYLPLHVGGKTNGLLVAADARVGRGVLEPAGRLMALAIERERLLAEAAHLEAARQSDALKTSLLRAVSHDLRTPLTAIRLETESLERQLAGRSENAEALASLAGLSREQERLTRRIDNLLSLARLEAGVARPHPEPVPPADLFRAAREGLASILRGRQIEVGVETGCPDLWTDPSLALEIVVNLLENAARADLSGRPIELKAARAEQNAERVWLEVRDRGAGLPEEIRLRFDSLSRPRHGGEGSGDSGPGGLGLRIARHLAEANGGTLTLAGRPGGGTVARLELPAAPGAEA